MEGVAPGFEPVATSIVLARSYHYTRKATPVTSCVSIDLSVVKSDSRLERPLANAGLSFGWPKPYILDK